MDFSGNKPFVLCRYWFLSTFLCFLSFDLASGDFGPFYHVIEAGNGSYGVMGDGAATSTEIWSPNQMTASTVANINGMLIAETGAGRVRKIDSTGIMTTFAGSTTSRDSSNGLATTAVYLPDLYGVSIDATGNVFVASGRNIYMITSGVSTRLSGTNICSDGTDDNGDNGPATSATLCNPRDLFASGTTLYFADSSHCVIRSIDDNGIIVRVAGTGSAASSGESGAATSQPLYFPWGLFIDTSNNIYTTDNGYIKLISASGIVSVFAGTGSTGYTGDGGQATAAKVYPVGVYADPQGNVVFAEQYNYLVRVIDTDGILGTIAGTGVQQLSLASGMATAVSLYQPVDVFIDSVGVIHVSDYHNLVHLFTSNIPTVSPACIPSIMPTVRPSYSFKPTSFYVPLDAYFQTVEAGTGDAAKGADGIAATSSAIHTPQQLIYNTAPSVASLLLTDASNNRVRKYSSDGIVTNFAGVSGSTAATSAGIAATAMSLSYPTGITVDSVGNTLISDIDSNRITKIAVDTFLTSIYAGTGVASVSFSDIGDKGPATSARFSSPYQLFTRGSLVYVSDNYNAVIRAIDSNGIISIVAGNGVGYCTGAAGPATSTSLYFPNGIYGDSVGNLYITEQNLLSGFNYYVKQVSADDGIMSVFAGVNDAGFAGDGGPATSARLFEPFGVYGDIHGNVYVTDSYNKRVRAIDMKGQISTILGNGENYGVAYFTAKKATETPVYYPAGIFIDSTGVMHVGDAYDDVAYGSSVRRLTVMAPSISQSEAPTFSQAPTITPTFTERPIVDPTPRPTMVPSISQNPTRISAPFSDQVNDASSDNSSSSSDNTGAVAGAAVGGIVVVGIAVLIFCRYRREQKKVATLPVFPSTVRSADNSNRVTPLPFNESQPSGRNQASPYPDSSSSEESTTAAAAVTRVPAKTVAPISTFVPVTAQNYYNPNPWDVEQQTAMYYNNNKAFTAEEARAPAPVDKGNSKKAPRVLAASQKSIELSVASHARQQPKWVAEFAKRFGLDEKDMDYFMGKTLQKEDLPPLLLNRLSAKSIPDIVKFEELAVLLMEMTDVFLTHNWGVGADNHKKVAEVNRLLHEEGIVTWFDEERMTGDIKDKMQEGIDNCACVVVFITKEYMRKVGLQNDNCALEFKYACNTKMTSEMVPVVMEAECCNNKKWTGRVALELGGLLFTNMSEGVTRDRVQELAKHVVSVMEEKLKDLVAMWLDKMRAPIPSYVMPEGTLYEWLSTKVSPSNVEHLCALFMEAGIGSIKALVEKFLENPQFLYDFDGVDEEDVDDIVMALEFLVSGE